MNTTNGPQTVLNSQHTVHVGCGDTGKTKSCDEGAEKKRVQLTNDELHTNSTNVLLNMH